MEFYEQGKLLFQNGRTLKSALSGVQLDMYIAAADAFITARDKLYHSNPRVSQRSAKVAYHLYKHCMTNSEPDSDMYLYSYNQLQTFVF